MPQRKPSSADFSKQNWKQSAFDSTASHRACPPLSCHVRTAVVHRSTNKPSNIYLKPKKAGGMKINFQVPPKGGLDEKLIYQILKDYKMLNAEVLIRDEYATVDDLIHTIMNHPRKNNICV